MGVGEIVGIFRRVDRVFCTKFEATFNATDI